MQFFAQLHLWQCLVWMEVSCHQPVGKISFWHPNCNYWDQVRELQRWLGPARLARLKTGFSPRVAKSSEEQLFGGEVVQRAPQDLTESGALRFVRINFQDRRAGAGPGGRISGSPVRTCWRVTKKTAAVQVGNRSRPGTSSAASVGKKAQCHPNSSIRITAAAASSTASTGDKPPATKSGKATIWMASAAIATPQASRCLGDLIRLRKSNTLIMAFT
jgi:hypothetical protein